MRLTKKSWDDISINDYYDILEITEDESRDVISKNIATLAVLCECSEDDIYNLTMPEVKALVSKCGWLNSFDFDKKFKSSTIKINGEDYDVCVDLQKMSVAQYIDFQTFWSKKDLKTYYGNVLACFIVPKGHKYGDGYDVNALAETFRENIPITTANSVCFFFLKDSLNSIQAMRLYLRWTLKRMRRMEMTEENRARIREVEQRLENMTLPTDGSLWSIQ